MATTDPHHGNLSPANGAIHVLQAFTYANAAARTGATGFTSADIGKAALQTDNNTLWFLSATTPTWVQIGAAGGTDATGSWLFGNGAISATTTTRYLTPGFDNDVAPISVIQIKMPRSGTLQKMRVHHGTAGGNGNNIVYTVRKNGSATSIVVTMAANTTDGSDLTNTSVVAAGDLIDIEVTKASSVGSSPADVTVTMEFAA